MQASKIAVLQGDGRPLSLPAPPVQGPESLAAKVVQVMAALQTTLQVERLVWLFSQSIRDSVPHDGMRYAHAEESVEAAWGLQEGEALNYRLTLDGDGLGELTLFGRQPLCEHTLGLLDYFTGCLLHPLSNALAHRRLERSATRDPLTGIGNRRALEEAVAREVAFARRHGTPFSLVVADIDHFKVINDTHGHDAGDDALCSVVACFREEMRAADTLYRFGGEEFVVLLANTDLKGASNQAERLRNGVAARIHRCGPSRIAMTASFGVGEWQPEEPCEQLFRRADAALYEAKHQGRNRVCTG